jgi:hypothetical protein
MISPHLASPYRMISDRQKAAIRQQYMPYGAEIGFDIVLRIDHKLAHAKKAWN